MIYMHFEIIGRVIPYVRMTQRSKYKDPQAKRYLAWKEAFGWELKAHMNALDYEMILKPIPLHIGVIYYLAEDRRTRFDLSNVIKGVEDAAQGIVFENDSEVDSITSTRYWNADEYKVILIVSGL